MASITDEEWIAYKVRKPFKTNKSLSLPKEEYKQNLLDKC